MGQLNHNVRARTRAAIMDAAAVLFRNRDFATTSMDEIARDAGVGRATLYNNFESKDDIAVGIAEQYRARGYAQLLESRASGANALTLLEEFFTFAGGWIAENRDVAFVGTTAAIRGVGRAADRPGTTTVLEELVKQGQAEGLIRCGLDPAVAARLLGALLTQAALTGPDPSEAHPTRWPVELLRTALAGLLPDGGSRRRKPRPSQSHAGTAAPSQASNAGDVP